MSRLNLTLDADTANALARHAKRAGAQTASFARELLRDGLRRRDLLERRRKVAADYAAGRADGKQILAEMEGLQLELLDEEDA